MEKTMKRMLSLLIVAVMVFGMIVPATPLHAHAAEEATDQVAFGKEVAAAAAQIQFPAEGKTFIADCPVCGKQNAEWMARGEGSGHTNNVIEGGTGSHYYLVGDATQIQKYSEGTTCVHLNGHNVTNATANAILFQGKGEGSELNIMGSGVVTGGRVDGNAAVLANIYGTAPVLNLYGGTYKKVDKNLSMIWLSAADRTLNIYAGATLDGTGATSSYNSAGVHVNGGTLNVYGGKIINGLGTMGGDVYAQAGTVNIEGAAVIGQMYVGAATVTFGTLTNGASIGYKQAAAGKIADDLGAYAGKYIHAYEAGASVINAATSNLTYSAPKYTAGYCPVCDAEVTWTQFGGTLSAGTHQYLTYTGSSNYTISSYTSCFHMNGNKLEGSSNVISLAGSATLNIMGNGTLSGSRTEATATTVNIYGSNNNLNLYGVTVTKGATNTDSASVISPLVAGFNVTLNDGAKIDLTGTAGSAAVKVTGGSFTMNGGTITGGNPNSGSGGNIYMSSGSVTINAGTISNGTATTSGGGNIMKEGGALVINGGTITGGNAGNSQGGNIKIAGGSLDVKINGGTITGGTAALGQNIYVTASNVLNITGGTIDGDVYANSGTVNVSGKDTVMLGTIGKGTATIALNGGTFANAYKSYTSYACLKDNGNETFTIIAAEHGNEKTIPATEGTCQTPGLTEGTACADCGAVITEQQETVYGDHVVGDFVTGNENPATYDATGSYDKIYTCELCQQELHETVITAKLTKVTDALAFLPDSNVAYCPVCETDVEWEALKLTEANTLTAGKHYYLNGAAGVASGAYMTMPASGEACVHLNGNDITCTGGASVLTFTGGSTVNIMGSGNVATTSNGGQTMNMGSNGKAVLYGGTYKNNGTGPVFYMQTATLQVEAGATVLGNNGIKLAHGTFGSTAIINGGNISQITLLNDNSLTLNGAPVIGSLSIPAGKTITLGELTEGADITVDGQDAFTAALDNAASYLPYFKAASEAYQIEVVEGKLAVTPKGFEYGPELNYTQDLEFSPDVENLAWCAVCGEHVEWTAWDGSEQLIAAAGKHYYLTQDATANFWFEATGETCLHLNGKNWNREDGVAINVAKNSAGTNSPVLNILGSGNVSGNGTYGATIYAAKGQLNLYSGNYTKNETATGSTANVIRLNNNAGMYLGDDVVITDIAPDGLTIYSDTTANVYVVEGATVTGKFSCTGGQSITVSGDAQLSYLVLKNGSKVTVGELTEGASIGVAVSGRENTAAVFAENVGENAQYFVAGKPAEWHIINTEGTLSIADHELEETVINAATCTEPGLKNVSCDCGYEAEGVEIEPTGHTAGAAASCTEDQICTVCQEVIAEATGHQGDTIEIKVIEATCTEAGSREIVTICTVCDEELFDGVEEIPALGHEFVDGKCTVCGAGQCDEGHTAGEPVKQEGAAATCTNAGYYVNVTKCEVCDTILDFEVVTENPVPHEYVDGKCTVCGADEPTAPSEPEEPAGDPVATINGKPYTTVKDAADAAVEGDTIILTADSNEPDSKITLWPGVTLDLNGNTLTAYLVNGALDAFITDGSADKTGLLAVQKVAFNESNGDMPVWTADGYRFLYVLPVIHDFRETGDANKTKLRIRLDKDNYDLQLPFVQQIQNTNASTCKLRLRLRLTWNSGGEDNLQYINFAVGDLDTYANYANGWQKYVLTKELSGVEGMENMLYITPEIYAVDENGNTLVTVAGETKLATIG